MAKIALLYTGRSGSERDLAAMTDRLETELGSLDGTETDRVVLDSSPVPYSQYDLLVFCGYDHVTLAHIHLAMDSGAKLIIFDEPGKSIERELNSVLFSGMDAGRLPPSSLGLITHSWNHKDIVGIAKLLPRTSGPDRPGPDRARQVESSGKSPARKGTGTAGSRGSSKSVTAGSV
jgi:hypothetical protein